MRERISPEEVRKVAALAGLALDDADVPALAVQLGAILDYVAVLREVPMDEVPPTAHPNDALCPPRVDEAGAGESGGEALMRAAPATARGFFAVPPIREPE